MRNSKSTRLFKNIKLLILDVDGVLTKGEIIYDDRGRELKIFNVKDGLGIALLNKTGFKTVFLTARAGKAVERRARDMRVTQVIAGILPKENVLTGLIKKYKVDKEEICFMGDDLIDVGLMQKVGVPVAVNDAPWAVKEAARYVTTKGGGQGAVREVVDLIIKAQHLEKEICHFLKNP